MTLAPQQTTTTKRAEPVPKPARRPTSLFAHGEPMVWLSGGTLVVCLAMIAGLLGIVVWFGVGTFWPREVLAVEGKDGARYLGEVTSAETYTTDGGVEAHRRLFRTENFELSGLHYQWISDHDVAGESRPEWALLVERMAGGRFYGYPTAFLIDGVSAAGDPATIWAKFQEFHGPSRERLSDRQDLETHEVGRVNRQLESARLELRMVELDHGVESEEWRLENERYTEVQREVDAAFTELRSEIDKLNAENARYVLLLETADGQDKEIIVADVVRAVTPNRIGLLGRVGVYLSRWWEFLSADPREANSEGGVFPAIFGTVAMALIMSVLVVPFGVVAALYLREYAKQGAIVSAVRIAVNNLAGVPSIVFGVFGLGFFCYLIGAGIDSTFFRAKLPDPTFGTGGLLWASFTLALLTLPVVIVATEEALSAVPNSMREGSYACGATKWQTIKKIVLPRAAPGIMTGTILAIARGAGEVAPLMLVGVLKMAPELPVDGVFPYVHAQRSFMHLGFHIFDVGFQSQNSEAAKPMVFTTTLLLITIIVLLNLLAIWTRARLRKRFLGAAL